MTKPTLHIDLETRSTIDLRKTGVYVYAEHLSTDVWCAAYAIDDGPIELWTPEWGHPEPVRLAVQHGWPIVAHNAAFERIIWKHILTPRYGWPEPKLEQWRCTMVMAYEMGLPGSLENAAAAVGLTAGKDMEGRRLMLQMSKPRLATKKNPELRWWDDQEKLDRLYAYCKQDVEVERQLEKRLLPLRPLEQTLWQLDQKINDRGVLVDRPLCDAALAVVATTTARLDKEIFKVTDGGVRACSNVQELKTWIADYGLPQDGLAKDDLAELLKLDLQPEVRRALEIRQEASKASVSKIAALLRGRSDDGRARGLLQFYAASPGRWGGRRFQPHNLKRPELIQDDEDLKAEQMRAGAIEAVMTGDADVVEMTWGPPLTVVGDLLRSMVVAAPGRTIMAADYSNVEGCGSAWLAGEEKKLQAYRAYQAGTGPDLYKVAAADIYGISIGEVDKPKRQIGKVSELACGYQGAVGAFQKMAYTYGVKVPDEQAASIVKAWRLNNPNIVQFWWDLDDAARFAVEKPGQVGDVGKIKFKTSGSFLFMQLPNRRCLVYPYPRVVEKLMPWGDYKDVVTYKGIDSYTRKWGDCYGYGGLWLQNATEAICRDLLAEAMLRFEAKGFPVILTVHDEVVCEPPLGFGTVENFESEMCVLPGWAEGFPVAASGFEGARYHK